MPPILEPKKVNFPRIMFAGLVAGVGSAALCVFYKSVYTSYTGFELEQFVNMPNIVLACMAGAIVAALGYFVLCKLLDRPQFVYSLIAFVGMLATLVRPVAPVLPDGTTAPDEFAWLTIPMHVFTGMIVLTLIPLIGGGPTRVSNY